MKSDGKKLLKRISAVLATGTLLLLTACGGSGEPGNGSNPGGSDKTVEISLWTYPVGGWGNAGTVSSQLAAFHRDHPEIRVTAKIVDYKTGDDTVKAAIENHTAPDLILEGPERLVANWGAGGYMADIADLWQGSAANKIYDNVKVACHDAEGRYYIYPMCMTTHCMAINRDMFEAADAWQYVDEATHTWTTENFFKAVAALKAHGMEKVAAVYCGGQGGDQGTRALVNNLYGGTFTNEQHTEYTLNSEKNIQALEKLQSTDGISFDDTMDGGEEIEAFCSGELAMAFCWSVSQEIQQTINKTLNFDVFPMAFPTNDGNISLQGGIWGFGVFDNGDAARIDAAKTFIRYMLQDDAKYSSAVNASTYWPVRDMPELYLNDELMIEYGTFSQYLGDYYQVAPNWANARTAWWKMLQRVGRGEDVSSAVEEFSATVNAAPKETA